MASVVYICSAALLELGARPINSLTESSEHARLCAGLWPIVRDDVLRSHPWNCAIKRTIVAADSDAPAYDYAYQFTLPSDWLRTLSVGEYGAESDYKAEGRKILCDDATLKLRYVYRNEDPETYDAMLVRAMTLAMSARMAYAVTQSSSQHQLALQVLDQHMKRCRAVDGQDDPPETLGDFALINSRGAGSW